ADINHGIGVVIDISRNKWKYSSDMITDLNPDLPHVNCVIDEINQVILNMIVNAAHAIDEKVVISGEKGKIIIKTDYDNDHVYIKVTDNGTGIPKKNLPRIFDLFFTTKEVGIGTGQGLA